MTNERNNTSKKPRIQWVRKAFAVSACLVFLFSILFPFYHITYGYRIQTPEYGKQSTELFWSFRAQFDSSPALLNRHFAVWVYNNSFYNSIPGPSISITFLFMFVAQILTMVVGGLFIQKGKSIHALGGMILTIGIAVSMMYVKLFYTRHFQHANTYVNSYEIGFWLTCLSVFLFLSSFIISYFSN